jgi:hypothetical protein
MLVGARPNLLLEGSDASTDAVLLRLAPHLCEPIVRASAAAAFIPPVGEVGALILSDVDALSGDDQSALLAWLANTDPRTTIVSTTTNSLFALVRRGLFDVGLYYRLNVMLLQVDVGDGGRLPVSDPVRRDLGAPG